MFILITNHRRGRIGVVPGACWVETEFVCAYFLPVIPRRSFLVFADPSSVGGKRSVPTRLSPRSIFFAYARPILYLWAFEAMIFPWAMSTDRAVPADEVNHLVLSTVGFFVAPALLFGLIGMFSRVSPARRVALARTEGLPPEVARRLEDPDAPAG